MNVKKSNPIETFQSSFTRSSGPGGQNVNKVATKVELRFNVDGAAWLPKYIRLKLCKEIAVNRVNTKGEYIITSSRTRTQLGNLNDCVDKIYSDICRAAETVPKPTSQAALSRTQGL
ncbi:hypothetical protein DSO57_1021182 [Entomophthora muscae]|uniref:Uncharacterized protein n=1 Tax=Entomophthora muscae TaxID=34485 RepID=A0ACC2SGH1_9FUNG|nr:hypothetical protein DSO57_1021182 [Entomophthora muscae]